MRRVELPVMILRSTFVGLMLLMGLVACEPITAPTFLVYADRSISVPVTATGWRTVTAGGTHSCAIRTTDSVYCWGGNASGQLGVGVARGQCGRARIACEASPRAVAASEQFRVVSAGQRHTCAISRQRMLYCWGESLQYQTGVQGASLVAIPMVVRPDLQFIDVGAGTTHTCAVRTNGVVYCWGEGSLGALGRGDTVTSVIPQPVATTERFVVVRSGRLRSCAIALDGSLWCWGAQWESSDGFFDFYQERLLPYRVANIPPLRDVAVGITSICAVTVDGVPLCWESNQFAQLGLGSTTGTPSPTPVVTERRFVGVTTGIIQTCGISSEGMAFCWGNNSFGQLGVPRPGESCGDAALECSRTPIAVFGRQRFSSVSTGAGNHTCGVTTTTAVLCWGLGSEGQLGDGFTRDRQSLPVGVLSPSP